MFFKSDIHKIFNNISINKKLFVGKRFYSKSFKPFNFKRFLDVIEPHFYTPEDLEPASVHSIYDYDSSFVSHPGKSIIFHKRFNKKLFNSPIFIEEVVDYYEKNKRLPRTNKVPFIYEDGSGKYIAEASNFQAIIIFIVMFLSALTITIHMSFYDLYEQLYYMNRLIDLDFAFCEKMNAYLMHDEKLLKLQYNVQRSYYSMFFKKKFEIATFLEIKQEWNMHRINFKKLQIYFAKQQFNS